jgi:Icc-related predicted phosphoesterase
MEIEEALNALMPDRKFTRIFYATDVHGSELCFKKFLSASRVYEADLLILGGDITGKMIVPLIEQPDGSFRCDFAGREQVAKNKEEATRVEENIKDSGYYPYYSTPEEFEELRADKAKLDKLFREIMRDNLLRWVRMADERLNNTEKICYITGGNDDHQDVMDAVKDTAHVKNPDNKVLMIDDYHEMASLGWGNPTPWKAPRDCSSEEELEQRVEKLISGLKCVKKSIFNFHVPPKDCGLDNAPLLDTSVYPPKPVIRSGVQVFAGVGSESIRAAVAKLQPLLVLSGHIHESRGTAKIGKTLVINPGSEYSEGILRGALINLGENKIMSYQLTSG